MKQVFFEITENVQIADNVMKITFRGDTSAITAPGQFVNIKLDGFYLRRPISVCDYSENLLTLIYKIVGEGTKTLAECKTGDVLDVLTGLGNGYDLSLSGENPLLVGGGVGVPPMYKLCASLAAQGKKPTVVLGFNTASDVFYEEEFKALGAKIYVTTLDGTVGTKGVATDVFDDISYTYVYTCGPEPMLKAVYNKANTSGQFSFEERMGCGFGACMGCSCETKYGNKRICKDGPVLKKEEIIW